MTPEQLRDLDDDQLAQLIRAARTEQERRDNLASIPPTVADLAAKYRDGGGDPEDLRAAIDA